MTVSTDRQMSAFASEIGDTGPVAVEGCRTRWQVGGALQSGTRLVKAPTGILEHRPEEMTVRVRAGTPVDELVGELASRGQRTALVRREGTVGGALVVGENDLSVLGRGRIRDCVLQVRYVSAEGVVITGGGPTVKNVSGFDLPRLIVGSLGTLGLIGEVILRTNPVPKVSRWMESPDTDPPVPNVIAKSSAVLWDGTRTWVELEGHPVDVQAQQSSLAAVGHWFDTEGPPELPASLVAPTQRSALPRPAGSRRVRGIDCGGDRLRQGPPAPPGPAADDGCTCQSSQAPVRSDWETQPGSLRDEANLMDLHLDADELATCVQCGLCLPHCPTFRVSGDESQSPRGRIALMRAVHDDDAPFTLEVRRSFETCVQCRGCETACPSGVPFGHLMEKVRESLADARQITPRWQRAAFVPLSHPRLLRAGSRVLAIAQRASLLPQRLGLPTIPLHQERLRASGDDVYLFTGCVMDAWQRDVHFDTQRVIEAAGFTVRPTGDRVPCCGALHAHAGLTGRTMHLASQAMRELAGTQPILVDSAGCGAAMKEYGALVGTDDARCFSRRVYDVGEWLAANVHRLPARKPLDLRIAVQDPCHLRHVQRAHQATRTVLAPYVRELVELDDEGLCCGAGGAYSILQPEIAQQIKTRKLAAIEHAAPDIVASANPGCSMHLAAAGVTIAHPSTLLARALAG